MMSDAQIKFGTSGWRAIVADEFTHRNVRRAVTGIARYVAGKNSNGARVIVGRDPRYMGETFVSIAADILAEHGITPLVIDEAAPTPAIAFEITRLKADGGLTPDIEPRFAECRAIQIMRLIDVDGCAAR